ncbi:hypothetical protein MnTg02_02469 [bacterium MnTg02]|nr:hypothetical protein MnTg02_02469 [bacterium MnTg02]
MTIEQDPFWKRKSLADMTAEEWESLCDGCGLCCLIKLEDDDTGERFHTRIVCRLLDLGKCRCTDYRERHTRVPDCLTLTAESIGQIDWLPQSCAYRLINEKKDLYWWHPLISGDPNTVHDAGVSVRDWAISETRVRPDSFQRYIIQEPMRGG